MLYYNLSGEVAEWPNAYAWKAYMAEMSSGVRIPPPPQKRSVIIGKLRFWRKENIYQ